MMETATVRRNTATQQMLRDNNPLYRLYILNAVTIFFLYLDTWITPATIRTIQPNAAARTSWMCVRRRM